MARPLVADLRLGCASWSCLDCRADDGAIVTASNGEAFANTGHTLASWLSAWLAGIELFEEMFEPGPTRAGINPFTKQPIVNKGQGKPRGTKWPWPAERVARSVRHA